MAYKFTYNKKIPFADTDAAGLVHFSNFFRYMEEAEHQIFMDNGLQLIDTEGDRKRGWPRRHASCDFLKPLFFGDACVLQTYIVDISKGLTFLHLLYRGDRLMAKGKIVCRYVEMGPDGLKSLDLPEEVTEKLSVAPPEIMEEWS